jgi:hypothetical protein
MANFNAKYDNYVRDLPKYVLKNIKDQISEKYPIDAENEFIDALFARKHQSYKRKREYDIGYYNKLQNTNEAKTNKLSEEIQCLLLRLASKAEECELARNELVTVQANLESLTNKHLHLQSILKGALDWVAIYQEHNSDLGRPKITPKEEAVIRTKLGLSQPTSAIPTKKKLRPNR